jgi:hypothetical protein
VFLGDRLTVAVAPLLWRVPDEALTAIEEAVSVYRRLRPLISPTRNSHSPADEALAAIEEAVGVFRRLAAANPAAYEPNLIQSLHNLSVRLAAAERRDEAEQVLRGM